MNQVKVYLHLYIERARLTTLKVARNRITWHIEARTHNRYFFRRHFECILFHTNLCILIDIWLKKVVLGPIDNTAPSPHLIQCLVRIHDDVIKWKHFPRYWPFVRGIHLSPVNSPHKPVTRSFVVFFDLCPNKRLSKHWRGWWFETQSRPLWRHCNAKMFCGIHLINFTRSSHEIDSTHVFRDYIFKATATPPQRGVLV